MKGLLLAAALATAPAPVTFDVALDRTNVAVGDRVVATYSARIPAGASIELEALVSPALEEAPLPAGTTALDFEAPPPARVEKGPGGSLTWRRSIPFAPFAAGELAVPGPRLVYVSPAGERIPVRPPAVSLSVASRLPKDQKPETLAPRADKPVRIPARGAWFWGSLALLAALLVAALLWLWNRPKKAAVSGAAGPPPLPPDAEFLAALEALAKMAETLGGDPRPFYSDLTHAAKRYLERRISLPVLEWTTFETVRRLRDAGIDLPREAALAELLSAADHVKFGKGSATREEARQHLTRARHLHDVLEARLARAETAAEGGMEKAS